MNINIILNGLPLGLSKQAIKDHEYDALSGDELMFESCSLEDIDLTYLYGKGEYVAPMFEAITTTKARVEKSMKAFHRALSTQFAGTDITVSDVEISAPKVSGGFATLTARFPLSDGQSIGIIFHSPSGDAAKITESDTLVAFRFLLNRRDVTPTVAPAGGADVSLKVVALKLSNLAERNSAQFQLKQSDNNAKASDLTTLQAEVETKEAELNALTAQADKTEIDAEEVAKTAKTYTGVVSKAEARVIELRKQLEKLSAAKKPEPKPDPESGGDHPVIAPAPKLSLSGNDKLELDRFILEVGKQAAVYEKIINGHPDWRGYDAKAFTQSIHNKTKTLAKNGKTAIVDGVLEYISQLKLSKPMFTPRHGIWSLGSGVVQPVTSKPTVPNKPAQVAATDETLTFVQYAMIGGNLNDHPKDAVDVVKIEHISANPQLAVSIERKGLSGVVGVLTYTRKLTDADITKYNLVDVTPTANTETGANADEIDFKTEVSNLISTHFGKTWHEIGLSDPQALLTIVNDRSRFSASQIETLKARANIYITDKRIEDMKSVFNATELYWYGLKARPFSIGATPRAQQVVILNSDEAAARFPELSNNNALRHGAVAYAAPLSADDIKNYEYVDLAKTLDSKTGLGEEDYDYLANDIASAILDGYAEGNVLTQEVADSLIQKFISSKSWILSATRKTYTVQNRKNDPERYEQLKTMLDSMTAKDFEKIISQYLETSPIAAPMTEDEVRAKFAVTDASVEQEARYFGSVVRVRDADGNLQTGKVLKVINGGDILVIATEGFEQGIRYSPSKVEEVMDFKDALAGANEPVEPVQVLPEPEVTQVTEGGEAGDKTEGIIKALETALVDETDSEKLMDLLEESITALEEAGTYDENEPLIDKVSDRITSLLEAEAV